MRNLFKKEGTPERSEMQDAFHDNNYDGHSREGGAVYHSSGDVELTRRTKKGGASVIKAVYHVVCAVAGIGVLGLPHALSLSGWGGVALLLLLSVVAGYTGVILSYCFVQDTSLESYSDLGMKAFGKWGKYAVHVAQMGTCIGTSILFLVLSAKNLDRVVSNWGSHMGVTFWIGMSALMVLPLCYLKTLHDIRWVTFAGMMSCIVAVIVIIVLDFLAPMEHRNHDYRAGNYQGFFQAFATITFAYGGHVIYPNIIRSMENPSHFPQAVYISSSTILVLYIPVAIISYWQFGSKTQSNILDNLSQNAATAVITFSLTAHVLFAYVLYLHPFFHILERKLGLLQEESRRWHTSPTSEVKTATGEKDVSDTEEVIDALESRESMASTKAVVIEEHVMEGKNTLDSPIVYQEVVPNDTSLKLDVPRSWFGSFIRKFSTTVLVMMLRTFIVGITMFIAMLIPFFGDLMDLVGASTQAMSIFILPCFIYVKLYRKQLSWFVITINLTLAILGLVAGGFATTMAVINIVKSASSYRVFSGS